jgi:hypothetical protein
MNENAESADIALNPGDCLCGNASSRSPWLFQGLFPSTSTAQEDMGAYLRRIQSEILDNEAAFSNFWLDSWKQSESMLVSWIGTQCRLVDACQQTLIEQVAPNRDPATDSAEKLLEHWHEAASQAVSLQNQWLGLWISMMSQDPKPSEASRSADEASGAPRHAATPSAVSGRRKPARAEELA